ncbi:hypothetical protein ACFE04_013325 [Oxalis oulophora]
MIWENLLSRMIGLLLTIPSPRKDLPVTSLSTSTSQVRTINDEVLTEYMPNLAYRDMAASQVDAAEKQGVLLDFGQTRRLWKSDFPSSTSSSIGQASPDESITVVVICVW